MLAGALGRPGDVEHVVEQLERQPDAAAEVAERVGLAAALERAEPARRLEQPRGLQVAAVQVAVARHVDVPRVLALQQLAPRQAGRRVGEHADLVRAAVDRQLGERAREQQVAGGRRDRAAGGGHDRRSPAAQRRGVEHVVVDERGGVDQLHRDRGAQHAVVVRLGLLTGREEDEERAEPLPARADRRARVLGQELAVGGRERLQALLQARHQRRDVRAAGLDEGEHLLGAAHGTVPTWSGDDAARGEDPADVGQPGAGHARRERLGAGEALHRARQVRVGVGVAGDRGRAPARSGRTRSRRTSRAAVAAAR